MQTFGRVSTVEAAPMAFWSRQERSDILAYLRKHCRTRNGLSLVHSFASLQEWADDPASTVYVARDNEVSRNIQGAAIVRHPISAEDVHDQEPSDDDPSDEDVNDETDPLAGRSELLVICAPGQGQTLMDAILSDVPLGTALWTDALNVVGVIAFYLRNGFRFVNDSTGEELDVDSAEDAAALLGQALSDTRYFTMRATT